MLLFLARCSVLFALCAVFPQACCPAGASANLPQCQCVAPLLVPARCFQGAASLRAGSRAAAFLQRRAQDGIAKVTVAGVGEPGKSVDKRVGRLAQKWSASAFSVRGALLRCVAAFLCASAPVPCVVPLMSLQVRFE